MATVREGEVAAAMHTKDTPPPPPAINIERPNSAAPTRRATAPPNKLDEASRASVDSNSESSRHKLSLADGDDTREAQGGAQVPVPGQRPSEITTLGVNPAMQDEAALLGASNEDEDEGKAVAGAGAVADGPPVEQVPPPAFLSELSQAAVGGGAESLNSLNPANLPCEEGFSRTTRARLEMPSEMLARLLLSGEEVVGEFDYYYPTPNVIKSLVTHVKLTLVSFGLYLLYILFNAMAKSISNCIGIGSVASNRGKMIVTSAGRLIFWQLKAKQWRWFGVDGRAYFSTAQVTRIMHVRDIRETTVRFARVPAVLFCCSDTKTSLEVIFNSFPYDRKEYSKCFYTTPAHEFINAVHSATGSFASFFNADIFGYAKSKKTVSANQCSQAMVLRLVSKEGDQCFTGGDHGMSSFESVLQLNQKLSSHLDRNEIFISPSDGVVHHAHDKLDDFKIVEDTDEVNIPTKYIPLTPGERVIAAIGHKYVNSTSDIWKSVLSLGLYWLYSLRHKSKQRTANVLTNFRVIELWYEASGGKIPASLSGAVKIRVRSVFPGGVNAGFVKSNGEDTVTSAILTTGGQFAVVLPLNDRSAMFAELIQCVCTRQQLDLDVDQVPKLAANAAASEAATKRSSTSLKTRASTTRNSSDVSAFSHGHCENLPSDVCQMLPLMREEKVFHYFDTNSHGTGKSDGGRLAITSRTIFRVTHSPRGCCSGKSGEHDRSVNRSAGKFGIGRALDPYCVVWLPSQSINGQSLDVKSSGAHPVDYCCSMFGCASCTSASDAYTFIIQSKLGFTFSVAGKHHISDCGCKTSDMEDAPYLHDDALNDLSMMISLLQSTSDKILPEVEDAV